MTIRMNHLLALAVLGAGAFAGCGEPPSPPPRGANVVIQLPDGDCHPGAPCALDFGRVEAGSRGIHAFTLVNLGGADDVVTDISLEGASAFQLHVDDARLVPAGGTLPFAITVAPAHTIASEATLAVATLASLEVIRVRLSVEGTYQGLQLSPECDFGNIEVGTTSPPCRLTITNPGETEVTIHRLGIEHPAFRPTQTVPSPVRIPGHGIFTTTFVAQPVTPGLHLGALSLDVDTSILRGVVQGMRVNGI